MIVAVIAAGIGGVAVVAGWVRWSSSRALSRSVEGYEKALDVLGEVAKHADQAPTVTAPSGDPAHPPIALSILPPPPPEPPRRRLAPPLPLMNRETAVPNESIARHPAAQPILPARRLNPPIPPGGRSPAIAPGGGHAQAPDEPPSEPLEESPAREAPEQAPVTEREPVGAASVATRPGQQVRELAARRRAAERVGHRVIAASAAVVVFVGAIVGAVVLTSHSAPPSTSGGTPTPARHHGHHRAAPSPGPPSTPTSYSPEKVTPQTVTYVVPSGTFTITMQAVGTCWLGIESSAGGPYLWMDTLSAGGSTSYHASGTVVLRIGAPAQLSVSIDGVPLELPARNVNPYDAVLETTSNAATTA